MVCARDGGRIFEDIGFLGAHWKAVSVCCGCPWSVVRCAFPPTSHTVLFSTLKSKSFLCPVCTVEKHLNPLPYWCQWGSAPNAWGLWNTFIWIYSSTTTLDVTPEVELDLTERSHLVPSTEAGGSTFPFLGHLLFKSFLFFPQPFEAVGQNWAGLGHPSLSFLHPCRIAHTRHSKCEIRADRFVNLQPQALGASAWTKQLFSLFSITVAI